MNDTKRALALLKSANTLKQKTSVCLGLAIPVVICPDYIMKSLLIDKFKKLFNISDLNVETKEFAKSFLVNDAYHLMKLVRSLDLNNEDKNIFIEDIRGICGINSN